MLKCFAFFTLGFLLSPVVAQEVEPSDSTASLPEEKVLDANAVAVLPFENQSTDPNISMFSAELYQEILYQLAIVDGLYVVPYEFVLPYADSSLPSDEIARTLGVGGILEASIQQTDRDFFVSVIYEERLLMTVLKPSIILE